MQGTHGEFHGVPYQPAETQALDLQAGVGAGHAIHQDPLTPVTVLSTGKIIRTINAMNSRILLLF